MNQLEFSILMTAVGFIVVVGVFWIPICVYFCQKWSYRCFMELQKTNSKLQVLIDYEKIKKSEVEK